jgi:undecaprenyl phosphate-alpha-L-ara4N flippase subunit ArnF
MLPATSDNRTATGHRQIDSKADTVLRAEPPRVTTWSVFLKWFANPWLQIALNAFIVTASEIFLKFGARDTAGLTAGWNWTGVTGLLSPWTWLGIVFLILSLVSWLYVLRQVPLSIAYPLSNGVHILVPLASWIFLGELIRPTRWWGIILVLIGLVIVAKPVARIEEKL